MKTPVFLTVLDLHAIAAAVKNDDEKQRLNGAVRALLAKGAPPNEDIIDNNAVKFLLNNFGPGSRQPCALNPLLSGHLRHPKPIVNEAGDVVVYYGFANLPDGQPPSMQDVQNAVTFEVVARYNEGETKPYALMPNSALGGSRASYIALMYMDCCGTGHNPPLCALTVVNGARFSAGWKVSHSAIANKVDQLFMNSEGALNVHVANEIGERQMLHRLYHAGGYGHDCGSHSRLKYTPR